MKILTIIILSSILLPSVSLAKDNIRAKTRIAPNGKLMCYKSNDIPKVSKKKKKWHMDRECCLDPYEIPNKHCYYPPKYQFLITKYNIKFK